MTDQSAYHYAVIARALKIIDAAGPALTLDDLAARMGMSAAQYQFARFGIGFLNGKTDAVARWHACLPQQQSRGRGEILTVSAFFF